MGYFNEIHYKPDSDNVVADALYRLPGQNNEVVFTALSAIKDPLLSQLQQIYLSHPIGIKLLAKFTEDQHMQINFQNRAGVLYFKD